MELKVTECCKSKGLTLQDLADRLGIARSTLANTLVKKNPTLETLEKISKALGVSVFDLIGEEEQAFHNAITCPYCGKRILLDAKKDSEG